VRQGPLLWLPTCTRRLSTELTARPSWLQQRILTKTTSARPCRNSWIAFREMILLAEPWKTALYSQLMTLSRLFIFPIAMHQSILLYIAHIPAVEPNIFIQPVLSFLAIGHLKVPVIMPAVRHIPCPLPAMRGCTVVYRQRIF